MRTPTLTTPARLGVYGVGLLVAFGAALGAGRLVGPSSEPAADKAAAHDEAPSGHGGTDDGAAGHAGTDDGAAGHGSGGDSQDGAATHVPRGLQVSEAGYRLVPETTALATGAETGFRFRILGPDGAPLTRYTPTHERDLHLIVVRRDLSGFQHLHPVRADDGLWSVPLTVAEAGQYRVFADFQPVGRTEPLTLGVDVPAAGTYQPRPPATEHSHRADADGYRVDLSGHLTAGKASRLTLTISRNGTPVTDLQPYLGAFGHLVALRDGDLAYLHVHPDEDAGPGPAISFTVEVPSAGVYGLFLDFRHGDAVHTAAFTTATE
jgi:hypothetical protein